MKSALRHLAPALMSALLGFADSGLAAVSIQRVPEGGLQPRVALGRDGVVHLVYHLGDVRAGDLYYCRREPGRKSFSRPVRVNQQPGAAVAAGAIRGAQIALERNDRVHIAWMGSQATAGPKPSPAPAAPKTGGHKHHHPLSPMLYTRMKADGSGFEPERNLVTHAWGLDGGGTVTADAKGHVYVFWHAEPTLTPGNEAGRSVYLAVSRDDGATFARERDVVPDPAGACGCCGMKSFVDARGHVHALYRTATPRGERNMTLLSAPPGGGRFRALTVNRWPLSRCPMSSAAMIEQASRLWLGTECRGALKLYELKTGHDTLERGRELSLGEEAKHPAIAVNARGEMLVAWLRGAGFNSGGRLCYQVLDPSKDATGLPELVGPAPRHSLVAAFVNAEGAFELLY